jgi:hypothetical protein
LPAGPRTVDDTDNRPTLALDPRRRSLAHGMMNCRVADNAAFADRLRAGLELRLDQRDEQRPGLGQRQRREQHRGQTDKACIAGHEIDRVGNVGGGQVAGVDALMHDDARILAQLPGKLAAPDIDRVNLDCAARKQHIGEPAGRGADIERDEASNIDREMVERMNKL